jgi:hypothetical protein
VVLVALPASPQGIYQRMSLSPVTAIADMVGPVVLITMAVIFANGLMTAGIAVRDRIFTLDRECLDILGGPQGEILGEDRLPPIDRERLKQIRDEIPLILRRAGRFRNSVVIIWISIGLLVLSVAAIAAAVTASSEAVAFVALALVLAGVAGVFTGIAAVLAPMTRAANVLLYEARRTGQLGLGLAQVAMSTPRAATCLAARSAARAGFHCRSAWRLMWPVTVQSGRRRPGTWRGGRPGC